MPRISQDITLDKVEHILGSGTGLLDFAVENEDYYTWEGLEDAEWTIDDIDYIENDEEDRYLIYPEGDYFICEIEADQEEANIGPVRCWCE